MALLNGRDLFTRPEFDTHTLLNLGPLAPMAGVWRGERGLDVHPVADGTETDAFVERYELHPIDPQTNGPQLLYGLRYHTHVTRPGDVATFHDQVGYWLWEPATRTVIQTVSIPRGQVALAYGLAEPDATEFTLAATTGAECYGICSVPFLTEHFKTTHYRITVTTHRGQSWSYEQDAVMEMAGRPEPFHHTDRNTLTLVAPPIPNPLAPKP